MQTNVHKRKIKELHPRICTPFCRRLFAALTCLLNCISPVLTMQSFVLQHHEHLYTHLHHVHQDIRVYMLLGAYLLHASMAWTPTWAIDAAAALVENLAAWSRGRAGAALAGASLRSQENLEACLLPLHAAETHIAIACNSFA